MQVLLVHAEEVSDLVPQSDSDLLDCLLSSLTMAENRLALDRYPVGQGSSDSMALGQRPALEKAEECVVLPHQV